MLGNLWTPTGGVAYHQRAREHGDRLWLPYREALAAWLETWTPDSPTLFLFGPSGGYTLTAPFLTRFGELRCFDPDPLAPLLFRRRHGRALREAKTKLWWSGADLLSEPNALRNELARHPDAAVLFSGLLGQLRTVLDPAADAEEDALVEEGRAFEPPPDSARWREWKRSLVDALGDHPWASVHDRVSGEGQVNLARLAGDPRAAAAAPSIESGDRADLTRELPDGVLRLAFHGTRRSEVRFHGAEGLLPERPRRLLLWPIVTDWTHLMEAVSR